jgi:hypothetical protein
MQTAMFYLAGATALGSAIAVVVQRNPFLAALALILNLLSLAVLYIVLQADFVAVAPFWNVGQVIDYLRESTDLPDTFTEIFVVDPAYKVVGSLDVSRILRSKRDIKIDSIMDPDRHVVLDRKSVV